MGLKKYHQKRSFRQTPEPKGKRKEVKSGPLTFVVQKHHASHLHYDFRLELDGVLKSWAIPKGPSLNPKDKRLAMLVEDHPLDYANFEGTIPKGNYGAGTVIVWDKGIYSPYDTTDRKKAEHVLRKQFEKGHITIVLLGEKLHGEFALVKAKFGEKNTWLLIKANDEYATTDDILKQDRSVNTHRTLEEISQEVTPTKKRIRNTIQLDTHNAPTARMPHQIKPMLAETIEKPFDRENWLFEVKWDGYRAVAEINNGNVDLYSRNHQSYTTRYKSVVEALKRIEHKAVLDGEIVVIDRQGRPSFSALQEYPNTTGELAYYVFDILHLNGHDLTRLPLVKRKEILRSLLPEDPVLRFSDHVAVTGKQFFSQIQKQGLEGMMAKDAQSTYAIGKRSSSWLKIKTLNRQEVVIAGFTQPQGTRKHFGALVLGVFRRGKLVYVGHTGSGFDDESLIKITQKLTPLIQNKCPFAKEPDTNAPVTWVKPILIGEVSFTEWTKDKRMRHPIFLGLREDKMPEEVIEETETSSDAIELAVGKQNITITHPEKIFWPKEKYIKADVIQYYTEISSILLPYLKDRPQSLLRFPHGITGESFFQKDVSNLKANWLKKIRIRSESEQTSKPYLLCQDLPTLLYMINLGCIDLNPWNSREKHLDKPDYVILDLDPEKASFDKVIDVALVLRGILEKYEIESFCKTSGKRGLHIYIPLAARYTYDQARQFAQLLCLHAQAKKPELISLKHDPSKRRGKIYLDYLRNGRGQTTASVYSVRAWPNATVSTPIQWSEINKRLSPDRFTMKTLFKRIDKVGDLFEGVLGKGITIEKVINKIEAAEN